MPLDVPGGGLIETVAETGSTNADLAARLRGGEALREGHWLIADRQTQGRGRLGREWFDGAGNFMGSTIVRPGFGDADTSSLALLAGLAVYETLAGLIGADRPAMLKWPNDVLVGGAKIAGILLEREGDCVIVGIGVNLARAPVVAGRETVALADLGIAVSRDEFAGRLARQFDLELERWRGAGLAPVVRRWLAAAHPVGTALSVIEPDGNRTEGTFDGLCGNGALQLRLPDGTTRAIHAGDVDLAPPQEQGKAHAARH